MSVRLFLALTMLALHWGGANAAADYPARPVTVVLPFPPGAIAELVARPLLHGLQAQTKQPFVISNRPGAGGGIGTVTVANAKPDGYTLLVTLSSMTAVPEAQKAAGETVAYRIDQFAPIARITAVPQVILVRADSPWKSIGEMIKDARSRPGKINFGSAGPNTEIHLATEMLGNAAGVQFFHVPYQGGAAAVMALLGSQIDFTNSVVQSVPLVRGGKARALAVYGDRRYPLLPDVPTLKEAGYDVEYYLWVGLFAPAGTPAAIVGQLRGAVRAVASDDAFKKTLMKIGTPLSYMDAPEFKTFLDADSRRLADVLKRLGPRLAGPR